MITDSFDLSKPFLSAEGFYSDLIEEENDIVTIVTFKNAVLQYVISTYNAYLYKQYKTTNGFQDIYRFNYKDKTYQFYVSGIGATIASTIMNEVKVVTGSHKFIYFGSCGVLNETQCRGKIIVPTSCYRDEGISYHYAPANNFIDIRNADKTYQILLDNHIPVTKGKGWTTDAIYMETVNKVNERKKSGVIAVDMEVSGVEAVARYLNIDNYHLLFSADSLDHTEIWQKVDLGGDKEVELQIKAFEVALILANNI